LKVALVVAIALAPLLSCSERGVSQKDIARERERIAQLREAESRVDEAERLKAQLEEQHEIVRTLEQKLLERTMLAAVTGRKPRLIVFTAIEWCNPCQQLQGEINRLGEMGYVLNGVAHKWSEDIGEDEDNSIQIVECSDDESDGAKWADKWNVKQYPTIVRVDAKGNQENRFSGVVSAEVLSLWQAGKWRPPRKLDEIAGN
jgi:hypothetical protein